MSVSTHQYDAIVVGSGAGGAAAAYRLACAGLQVLLLEKGNHLPADGSTLDIARVVRDGAFLSRERWVDGRGRAITPEERFNVGGKTKWYGAALLRMADREFLPDPGHQCLGWPLSASELAPYYDEAERLLAVRIFDCEPDLARLLDRLEARDRRWRASVMPMGLDTQILADRTEASHFDGFSSVRNLKAEAERSFLSPLRSRENFRLQVNSAVKSLVGSPESPTTITGVRLADDSELRARYVLLAAGALHSPRLLSRYLAATGLAESLPAAAQVGRYLKLHLLTAMVALSPTPKTDLIRKTVLLTNDCFPHSSVQPLGFDGELIGTLVPSFVPGPLRRAIGQRSYGFFLVTEDGSDPRNRVVEDPRGSAPPVLDYDAARLPPAAREHRAFTHAFQGILARAGVIALTKRIGLSGTAHACGSLICGAEAAQSVVDRDGHVHGLLGLYVVDGSVLPRSSRVNPSLTIYAWGLRVADLIARQFRRAPLPQHSSESGTTRAT
jgi:choline dehydrogenase-like flavoprotein